MDNRCTELDEFYWGQVLNGLELCIPGIVLGSLFLLSSKIIAAQDARQRLLVFDLPRDPSLVFLAISSLREFMFILSSSLSAGRADCELPVRAAIQSFTILKASAPFACVYML